jgi:hypothetical protein
MQKAKIAKAHNTLASDLCTRIENEKSSRRESIQHEKQLQSELDSFKGVSGKTKRVSKPRVEDTQSSSSGRVSSSAKAKGKAREIADPYPIGQLFCST